MKAIYTEPLLPQNNARRLFQSGDVTIDGQGRSLERINSSVSNVRLKKIFPSSEPVSLKKDNDKETQIFSQPRMSDLWYLWDVQEDPTEGDEDVQDYLDENMQGAKLVKTVIDISGGTKRRAFTMDYEWIPDSKTPSVNPIVKNAVACLEFLCGDLVVTESTLLLGEETGQLDDVREGGKLLPPNPAKASDKEEVLSDIYYIFDKKKVKILEDSPVKPFTLLLTGIETSKKFPTPGEFLGMAVRVLPNHAWFSQPTNPFIFSGNWFETNYYSSGKITKVIDISEDLDETDFAYDVTIRGKEILNVRSSDFLKYAVGDRVALLKFIDSDEVFNSVDMKDNPYTVSWRIIPVTFYQEN